MCVCVWVYGPDMGFPSGRLAVRGPQNRIEFYLVFERSFNIYIIYTYIIIYISYT